MIDTAETLLRAPEAYDPIFRTHYAQGSEAKIVHKGRPHFTVADRQRPVLERVGRIRNRCDEVIGFISILGLGKQCFYYEHSNQVYADRLTTELAVSLVVELQSLEPLSQADDRRHRLGRDDTQPGADAANRSLTA
jgi:hypothetical protein